MNKLMIAAVLMAVSTPAFADPRQDAAERQLQIEDLHREQQRQRDEQQWDRRQLQEQQDKSRQEKQHKRDCKPQSRYDITCQ
jgi:Ni/Co efflux regulator RcnB